MLILVEGRVLLLLPAPSALSSNLPISNVRLLLPLILVLSSLQWQVHCGRSISSLNGTI